MIINFNGVLAAEEDFCLTIANRAFKYADGVFETIRYGNGKIVFFEDHYFRLMADMRILRMEIPMEWSPEYLEDEIIKTIDANNLTDQSARIRLSVYREGKGYYTPQDNSVSFVIETEELASDRFDFDLKGATIQLFQDFYKPAGSMGNIKSVNSQIYTVAGIFARENGYDESMVLNPSRMLLEGHTSNVFLFKKDSILTPSLASGCVKGVLRKNIIDLLKADGLEVEETEVSPFELLRADEIWLTNTIRGIRWVSQYRKRNYESKIAEEYIPKLNALAGLEP
jgi:branched-chain amino acid aminotransferase